MHWMQTIETDVSVMWCVCQSVRLSVGVPVLCKICCMD